MTVVAGEAEYQKIAKKPMDLGKMKKRWDDGEGI